LRYVVVTGSNGGIGTAICNYLKEKEYSVIGIDRAKDKNTLDTFIEFDISKITSDPVAYDALNLAITNAIGKNRLLGLVNNAAVQILGNIDNTTIVDFKHTLDVNVVAPFALTKMLKNKLSQSNGSIVNIGSIHAKLTKPGFISYATSKTALLGLTQSLAVDCGNDIRVNAIQPAATATEMLLAGFEDNPTAFNTLKEYHPTGNIASPREIAVAVKFLLSDEIPFANGTVLDLNGGIGVRLHDPL